MPHIEKVTSPRTAPRHKASVETRLSALDAACQQVCFHGDLFSIDVGEWTTIQPAALFGDPVLQGSYSHSTRMSGWRFLQQLTAVESTATYNFDVALAKGIERVWDSLDNGVLGCSMYPATGQSETQAASTPAVDEHERKLDAAFAALMSYETEREDDDDRPEPRRLSYRFPR